MTTNLSLGLLALVGIYAIVLTPIDVTLVIGAVASLVTALGTAVAAIMAARRVERQVAEVHAETKVIGGHVNSAATAQVETIKGLQKELTLLREVMSDKKETAALVAQAEVIKSAATVQVATAQAATAQVLADRLTRDK